MNNKTDTSYPVTFALKDKRRCTIRLAVEDDARALCSLLPQMHAETEWLNYMPGEFNKDEEWERNFIIEQQAKPAAIMLLAEVDGKIIATAGAGSFEYKRYAHHAELGLSILKDYWGQGLGRKLMELLIEWGRARGLRKMYLKTFDGNDRAISLYDSLGFMTEARLKDDFLKNGGTYGDTIIMSMVYSRPA
jgi:RimJ/RimL family protein N-acetyltransferase